MYAGDEHLSDEQMNPELYEDGDPQSYPCDECGADAGEPCRPHCIAQPDDEAGERR